MLHRESVPFDSTNPLVDSLRNSLNEIHRIKVRLTDIQEQISDVLLQIQSGLQAPNDPANCDLLTPDHEGSEGSEAKETLAAELPLQNTADAIDQNGTQISDSIDLRKWLLDRGVTIRQLVSESPFEESFDRLALRLGRDFENLSDFYQALKRRIGGSPAPKSIVLKNYTADKINRVLQFGEELRRNGFLKEFRYIKPTRTLLFVPQPDGRVANFITGNWLERYVVITVTEHLRKLYPGQTVEVLTNPRVTLPDGTDFELDVLIACDAAVLWFECKTGKDYPAYLAKYGLVAKKVMQIGRNQAAMILLEKLTEREKSNNSQLAGMSVLNLKDVQRFLDAMKPQESLTDSTTHPVSSVPGPTALRVPPLRMNGTEWLAVLNREQLRPLDAELRRQIIEDFVAIGKSEPQPLPLRNVVNKLAAQYSDAGRSVSKAMINDIARALYRCGCCELGNHCDYPNKVWFLRDEISATHAFETTALLYLWACIRAREFLQLKSTESVELARVLWGGHVTDADADELLAKSISLIESIGRCKVESNDERITITALGDRFWEQPSDPSGSDCV